jgi:hypothetical protein
VNKNWRDVWYYEHKDKWFPIRCIHPSHWINPTESAPDRPPRGIPARALLKEKRQDMCTPYNPRTQTHLGGYNKRKRPYSEIGPKVASTHSIVTKMMRLYTSNQENAIVVTNNLHNDALEFIATRSLSPLMKVKVEPHAYILSVPPLSVTETALKNPTNGESVFIADILDEMVQLQI